MGNLNKTHNSSTDQRTMPGHDLFGGVSVACSGGGVISGAAVGAAMVVGVGG